MVSPVEKILQELAGLQYQRNGVEIVKNMKKIRPGALLLAIVLAASLCFAALNVLVTANSESSAGIYLSDSHGPTDPGQVMVTFYNNWSGNNNGGVAARVTLDRGGRIASLPQAQSPPQGLNFNGWNTLANGTGSQFTTQTIVNNNLHVYAQWQRQDITRPDRPGPEPPPVTPTPTPAATPPPTVESSQTAAIPPTFAGEATISTPSITPAAAVPEEEPPAEPEPIPLTLPPLASGFTTEIAGKSIPTAGGIPLFSQNGEPVWALVNLIFSILGTVIAGIFTARALLQKRKDTRKKLENIDAAGTPAEKKGKFRMFCLSVANLAAVAGIFLFLLTNDMRNPMVWLDAWSPLHTVIFAVGAVSALLILRQKKDKGNGGDDPPSLKVDNETVRI